MFRNVHKITGTRLIDNPPLNPPFSAREIKHGAQVIVYAFLRWLGVALWISAASANDQQPTQPIALLSAMTHALATLNYRGTVAIFKNDKLDTLQYFHSVQNGVEQERLLSLNSPLRDVVRNGDEVICQFTATHLAIIDHKPVGQSFLQDFPKNPAILEKNYILIYEGDAQVAVQPVDVILLKPRDQYRYTRKLWLAKDSHLPLKVEVQDFTGGTLEQVVFTELHVVETLPKIALKIDNQKAQHIHEFEDAGLDKLPIALKNVPSGFEKKFFNRTHLHSANNQVHQLLLSDGLSSVSVYMEKMPKNYHVGLQTAGAVNSLSRVIDEHLIIVIGDVPTATADLIAQGITFL